MNFKLKFSNSMKPTNAGLPANAWLQDNAEPPTSLIDL